MSMEFLKTHKNKFILGLIFFTVSFILFYKLGDSRLLDVDEPRYAEAAREMLESRNWITPYFNYELRFDKPIFYYWTIAWSYIVFGVNEFAARFSSALAGLLTVVMTFFYVEKTFNRKTALYSSLVLATMLEFVVISRMSITDTTLAFYIVSAIMTGFLGIEQTKHNKIYWWLGYIFCALGVLTKGPVAIALPVGIVGLYLLLTKQLKKNLKLSYHLPGIALFLAIALPWYILIIREHGQLFIDEFFIKHNLERFASTKFKQHHQPFWFFVPVILIGSIPWVFHLVTGIYVGVKSLFKEFKKENLAIFLWAAVVFVFYSISKAKLLTYILPIFPALAIIVGLLWSDFKQNSKAIRISSVSWAILCLIVGIGGLAIVIFNLIPLNELLLCDTTKWLPYITLIFILMPILLIIFAKKEIPSFALIVLMFASMLITKINIADPIIYNTSQKDFEQQLRITSEYKDGQLYSWGTVKPSLTFYSQKKVTYIDKPNVNEVINVLNSDKQVFIFTKQKHIDEENNPKIDKYKVYKGKKFSLITNVGE